MLAQRLFVTAPNDPRTRSTTSGRDSVTLLRARFAETDQMGVVHHSVYPVWFEAGRVEWMRERGMSYREMEESGLSLAVSHLEVVYRSAAYFDDEIAVVSTMTDSRSRLVAFEYRLERYPDGDVIATGSTVHVPTDRTGRAVRMPDRWRAALEELAGVRR